MPNRHTPNSQRKDFQVVSLRLRNTQRTQLDNLASRRGMTRSELIRSMIDGGLATP